MIKIYLAGKIEKNCWRHRLVPGLRHHTYSDGPITCDCFTYVGPFFSGCDHGCFHGLNTLGEATPVNSLCVGEGLTGKQVIQRSFRCIDASDVVIAYINARDCYGTIAEIQRAVDHGKEVIIAFAPGLASDTYNDFWFAALQCHRVEYEVDQSKLEILFRSILGGF